MEVQGLRNCRQVRNGPKWLFNGTGTQARQMAHLPPILNMLALRNGLSLSIEEERIK